MSFGIIKNAIDSIPGEAVRRLLYFYAFVGDPMEVSTRKAYMKKMKCTEKEIDQYETQLVKLGFLSNTVRNWVPCRVIMPERFIDVLRCMFMEDKDGTLENTFKEITNSRHIILSNLFDVIKTMFRGTCNADTLNLSLVPPNYSRYFWGAFFYEELHPLIVALPRDTFSICMRNMLLTIQERNLMDPDSIMYRLYDAWVKRNKLKLVDVEENLHLNRYFLTGEYLLDGKPQTPYGMILQAISTAYKGDFTLAMKYFTAAFKVINKDRPTAQKDIIYSPVESYLHAMICVHEGSDAVMKKLKKYTARKEYDEDPVTLAASALAGYFGTVDRKINIPYVHRLGMKGGLYSMFAWLISQYTGEKALMDVKQPDAPRSAIMRYELSEYLNLPDDELRYLRKCFGERTLLTSIKVKQPWQLLLETLMKEQDEATVATGEKQEDSLRMIYLVRYGGYVEIREQNRLRSGAWGAGKIVSNSRYISGNIDCMDDTDKAIWNAFRRSDNYSLRMETAFPELVGSGRVFAGTYAPFDNVKITKEDPYLIIEKGKNSFNVTANFVAQKGNERYASDANIVLQRSRLEYVVVPVGGKQRHVYEELLRIGKFPLEAEGMLKEFFPKMKNMVEVHSSTFSAGNTLETVDGTAVLSLQITPRDMEFHVNILACPLPGGERRFTPGAGMVLIPDEVDGKRVQVKRKLADEKRNYNSLVAYIEDTMDLNVDNGFVVLPAEMMLELIEYVRTLADHYVLEWPEGEKLRLHTPAKESEWGVHLRRRGGWFDVEGEVKLDDETVISISQLLDLVSQTGNSYIRLSENDYLRLSDNLRKQLQRLEGMTVNNRGKAQISAVQAGLLPDDVLNGEMTVQTDDELEKLRSRIAESNDLMPEVPSKLQATLRDYQVDGFRWMARLNNWGAGACLADDMGLGKTVQTIAYLIYMAKKGASLVLAPASVVPNWRKEIERFAPSLNVYVLNNSTDRKKTIDDAKASDVVVSSYGLLVSESEAMLEKGWNVVCLDEAHTIKNRETKTSAVAMKLKADNRLILTGTPVQNHLGELWNLFQFVNPGLLGSYDQFKEKFIIPIEQDHDKNRQRQLNRLVHPFMLRRTKREVVEELPDKEEIVLPVELSDAEMTVYEVIRKRAKDMIGSGNSSVSVATLAEITKLRQAACCAKLVEKKWMGGCSKVDRLIELMMELKEAGHRSLVFSQFTSFFAIVKEALDHAGIDYLYLDGSVSVQKREKLVEEFQEGDCPFFLISLKAGGLGLNLTGANYIIHLDPWWNPAIEQQATDRAYRIGQKQKVTAYHLVAANTIEEKILRLHESKRSLSDALLSGADVSHKLTAKDLMEILEPTDE